MSNLICGIVWLMALRALITSGLELESMQGRHSIPAAPMLILELQMKVREAFTIMKKTPTMTGSFKNLC